MLPRRLRDNAQAASSTSALAVCHHQGAQHGIAAPTATPATHLKDESDQRPTVMIDVLGPARSVFDILLGTFPLDWQAEEEKLFVQLQQIFPCNGATHTRACITCIWEGSAPLHML